jgi:nicotinamidase-related amidase
MDKYTEPDFSSAALITIDTQRDTLDGQSLEIPGTSAILPKMKKLLDAFRESNKPVIHVIRIYKLDSSNADLCRKGLIERGEKFLIENESGSNLADELLPDKNIKLDTAKLLSGGIQKVSKNEVIIYKPRWGAFYKTPLENFLREMKINTVIFCGCNFPNCPRTSIYEASERDFKIILASDAVSGLYERGINEMKNIGVTVLPVDDIKTGITSQFK